MSDQTNQPNTDSMSEREKRIRSHSSIARANALDVPYLLGVIDVIRGDRRGLRNEIDAMCGTDPDDAVSTPQPPPPTPEQQDEIAELCAKLEAAEKHLEIKEGAIRIMGSQIQQMQPRAALFPKMLDVLKAMVVSGNCRRWIAGCVNHENLHKIARILDEAESLERGTSK